MSNAQATVTAYLAAQKKTTNKDLAAEWTLIEELYNEKCEFCVFYTCDVINALILCIFIGCGTS